MSNQFITRKAVRQVLCDYWHQYQVQPWSVAAAFCLPAIGNMLVFFVPPLILARIIDNFVAQNKVSLSATGSYIALLGSELRNSRMLFFERSIAKSRSYR